MHDKHLTLNQKTDLTQKSLFTEEKFNKVFYTSPDSININRLEDGMYISINRGFTKMSGYSEDEVLGKTSIELNIWANPEDRAKLVKELKEKGEVENLETIFMRKNRTLMNGVMSAVIIDLDGIPHILSITRDITDKKEAEIALKKSEEKLQSIIRVAPVGIALAVNRILAEVNDDLCNLSGYSRNELIGQSYEMLFSAKEEYESVDKENYNQIADKGTSSLETVFKTKDNRFIYVVLSSTPIDRSDHSKGITFTVLDITERTKVAEQMKIAKEKAEASDKLKTSFMNNISHEVRTPINGIIGLAELIMLESFSAEERKEAINMVHESSERLIRTITNYMDISLLTSGSMSITVRNFNPAKLLKDIYNKFKPLCSARQLDLKLDIPDNRSNISFNSDPEILGKILSHFMDNAVKFTESGSIVLGYTIKKERLEFFVKDSGRGISEKSLTRIFQSFVKEDNDSEGISEGSGLGLAIAKGMAEIAGGEISVVSNPGEGSTFLLKMFLSDQNTGTSSDNNSKIKSIESDKYTILIAEDDEINFFYLKELLKRETNSIIVRAENGRKAVELVESNTDIKLILMDIKMPGIDGIEATRLIRVINPGIPIIAITAYAMTGDEDRVLASGCNAYLSKPISKKQLLDKIAEFVCV